MKTQFSMQPALANERFIKTDLRLKDIARDENAMTRYIQKKVRYAKAMGTLTSDNTNWHGVMSKESYADYMTVVARAKPLLLSAARDNYLEFTKSRFKFRERSPSPKRNRRDRKPGVRFDTRDRFINTLEDKEKNWKAKGNERKSSRDRRKNKFERKERDRANAAREEDTQSDRSDDLSSDADDESSDSDSAYVVIDFSSTCEFCGKTFDSEKQRDRHAYRCEHQLPETITDTPPMHASRLVCTQCNVAFELRNKLFQHLPDCKGDASNDTTTEMAYTAEEVSPKEAVARSLPDGHNVKVCYDTGCGRSLITKKFLDTLEHTVEQRTGKIKGVGKGRVKCKEYATFTLHLLGQDDEGLPVLFEVTERAWVIDGDFGIPLLFGTSFLDPRGVVISFEDQSIRFANTENFHQRFEREIVIPPGKTLYAPCNYVSLPSDRDFMFEPSQENSVAALVRSTTPYAVTMSNLSPDVKRVSKGTRVGTIQERDDKETLVKATWKGCVKAIMVAGALMGLGNLAGASTTPNGLGIEGAQLQLPNDFEVPQTYAINREYELTPVLEALATEQVDLLPHTYSTDDLIDAMETYNIPFKSHFTDVINGLEHGGAAIDGTPLSDAVFAMTESPPRPTEMPPAATSIIRMDEDDPLPKIPGVHTTLGIKKPPDDKEVILPKGQTVYTGKDHMLNLIEEVLAEFPDI
ncbi:hypothetical protein EKO27_g5768 [Xylaria grammica]|uniref:C2H2-type domain-containing protein n=1 Tax=Xylaria grammica TaxID=363999 RepID=A0A439D4L8_9PEZI|nr:hypothetical protein EKO27_g5768 [Xylaria grammica]